MRTINVINENPKQHQLMIKTDCWRKTPSFEYSSMSDTTLAKARITAITMNEST